MAQGPTFAINGVESVQNISFPAVWDDAQAPGFAVGAGAAAPTMADFSAAGSTASLVRLQKYSPGTVDRIHFTIQIPHDVKIPTWGSQQEARGTVALEPHVHWTLAPTTGTCSTGETVIWEMGYVIAAGSTSEATAQRFSTTASTLRTGTWTTSSNADQMGKHFISKFQSSGVNCTNVTASFIVVGTLHISSAATCTRACLLGIDWHYRKQPYGTLNAFSGY
jgi:hypothetical protein